MRSADAGRSAAVGEKSLWAAVLAVFFILSLGPVLHIGGRSALLPGGREIPLPYGLLAGLPFVDIMRSVSRLDVMVMLALGVLAAAGVAVLAGGRAGRWMPVVAVALIVFEFLPAPYPISPPDTPSWSRPWPRTTGRAACSTCLSTGPARLPALPDRPRQAARRRVHQPGGPAHAHRARTCPPALPPSGAGHHQPGPAAQGQQVLADLDVRWVVLDRYKMPGGEERAYTEAATAEIFGNQPPEYEDERITAIPYARMRSLPPLPWSPTLSSAPIGDRSTPQRAPAASPTAQPYAPSRRSRAGLRWK